MGPYDCCIFRFNNMHCTFWSIMELWMVDLLAFPQTNISPKQTIKIYSQAARHLYPALTVKVFFSLDFIYLVSLDRISGGYQEDILEQFEKSKMAAKMAAIVKKKLNHLILFIKSRVISLFPLNVIRGIHFWG